LKGLDTNVLVRYLVKDDPGQSARAAALVKKAVRAGETLFISQIAICETVWVLESVYSLERGRIAEVLADLLRARHVVVEETPRVGRALDRYSHGKGDLSDYLIGESGRVAGCTATATFDRALLGEPDFFEP
jgi:predicted nucleic-acid-binding protein